MPPKNTTAASKAKKTTKAKRARSPEESTATPALEAPPSPKRAKTVASRTVAVEKEPPTPAKLAGNFDIYAMYLPFLKKEYLPDGSSTPQFERLNKSILTYQAKNARTGRCFLPDTDSEGRFETVDLEDPMEEMPFDICINSIIVTKDAMGFTPSELASFVTPKTVAQGKGVTAKMELVEEHCGIASASGKFKMARAWVGEGDEPVELFEGYLEFGVKFGSMYTRKRLGSGTSCKFAFWAVRARKDEDGNEIGLEAFL